MKTIHKSYKFRLKTTPEQAAQCTQIAGVCRLIWNLCLKQRTMTYDSRNSRRKSLNSYKQNPEITQLCQMYDWIKAVPSQVLQQVNRNLDRAYIKFFEGRADFPEFKKRANPQIRFAFQTTSNSITGASTCRKSAGSASSRVRRSTASFDM